MPKSPHSSWNFSSRHVTLKPAPPRVACVRHAEVDHRTPADPDHQMIAASAADPSPWNRRLRHQPFELALAPGLHPHEDPRRALAEEQEIGPAVTRHVHRAAHT